jgi:hypothetical protein
LFEIGNNNVQSAPCQSIRFHLIEARTSQLTISCCAAEISNNEKTQKNDKTKNDDQRYAILPMQKMRAVLRGATHDSGQIKISFVKADG